MISEIQIENFKSIAKLSLQPGSVTVLIGENGSGKSNVLEAIAFAAGASADKLDDEYLFNRGIRVTDKDWMTSAFVKPAPIPSPGKVSPPIFVKVAGSDSERPLEIKINRSSRRPGRMQHWLINYNVDPSEIEEELHAEGFVEELASLRQDMSTLNTPSLRKLFAAMLVERRKRKLAPELAAKLSLRDFLVYAPENTVLRRFEEEGAIKPLGTKGEGLLKLLQMMASTSNGKFAGELKSHLNLLGWFRDLQLPTEADEMKGRLRIRDQWLAEDAPFFDQRSANEGFLYLLFYFTLFLSKETPPFFAIDNIDNALNPKLCSELMRQLAVLAVKNGKQVICTTHNPAILDGLNLHDDRQRLYVVRRNSEGHTVVDRVSPPRPRPDGAPVRLSNAFMSGLLGGLPEHF